MNDIFVDQRKHNILTNFIQRERAVCKIIYARVKELTTKNIWGATSEEIDDVAADTCTTLLEYLESGKLTIEGITFETKVKNREKEKKFFWGYAIGIAKNLWRSKLREKGKTVVSSYDDEDNFQEPIEWENPFDLLEADEQTKIAYEEFNKLNAGCQEVLTAFFAKKSFHEIGIKLGITADAASRRKRRCAKRWLEVVRKRLK